MTDKNSKNQKKKMPGGFLLFLFAVVLIILTIQSLTIDKSAKVSFSHQAEHLVNLDLIQPEFNRKIAQNDNLVTFTGKFRDIETQNSKDRFKFLQLLNENHVLNLEHQHFVHDLEQMQKNVESSALWFFQISGFEVPKNGFSVIGVVYDTNERISSVVIKNAPKANINLVDLHKNFNLISSSTNPNEINAFGDDLKTLVELFKSSKLGIGTEDLKQDLKVLDDKINALKEDASFSEKHDLYKEVLSGLNSIASHIMQKENNARLLPLRSVRNYLETVDQFKLNQQALEKNEALLEKSRQNVSNVIWFFNNKELSTRLLEKEDPEVYKNWYKEAEQEWNNFNFNKGLVFKAPDQERNMVLEKTFKSQEPTPNYFSYLLTLLPVIVVILVLYFVFSRQMKGAGSSAMNFGKSPAKLLNKDTNKVTFKDVAGCDESKEELTEIVDFLKDPQKFTALGARIPKGVLLVGPPGTGKTLIAKAVAGEAERPFFSISGSDFVEMFVGVGASRVRDLFDQGRKSAPCIIFVDEIDAVGRQRGAGIGGGHDEREQTLNQLLVEMDGFDTKEGVILMAATNRPDILDKALLRPGRFDRRVVLDLPDVKGRFEILKVHARRIKIDPSVDLMNIARITPGASGADLENILNEAALLAARNGRTAVTTVEAKEACDKVRYGKERRSLDIDDNEKRSTAFHEAGHAIVGCIVVNGDPVDKVTIIPRGFSLGSTHFMPKKNKLGYWRKEILDQLAICYGGRAAEEFFLKDMSSGAQQDIAQATKLARSMVCEWGMSEELGIISFDERDDYGGYLGMSSFHEKNYSDETAKKIDKEVYALTQAAYKRALEIIETNKEKVQLIADMLIKFETLDSTDIGKIMDGSWDEKEKAERLKIAEELQVRRPPPIPDKTDGKFNDPTILPQQT